MNYQETIEYLYRQLPMFSRVGAAAYKPGLDTSIRLDNFFENPHRKFRSIHIGGTNGKGSTSHLLASILQAEGYKTGLYTSPHLTDFRERIRVNGEMIPKEDVVGFVERYLECGYDGHPSFFELTMMMTFDYFAKEKVDYAIIEVGMGGRLDSTNIITPQACVITNISKDHTQFLGDTLPRIASEKAGIIKKDIPVVIGESINDEVRAVFQNKADEVGTEIVFAEDEMPLVWATHTDTGWDCISPVARGDFHCSLGGDYQKKNINTVLSAISMLRKTGIRISYHSVKEGFKNVETSTGLRGRWTCLGKNPEIICDTGHNEAGLKRNFRQLEQMLDQRGNGRLNILLGFVADKAIDDILRLLPRKANYFLSNAQIPRALKVDDLAEKFDILGLPYKAFPTVAEAYTAALNETGQNDILYVGGSTFIVADLLYYLDKQQ